MIDMVDVLNKLSVERPVFHSEADFQFALAWKIQESYPSAVIRLEKRIALSRDEIYIDIHVREKSDIILIEVKYKTKSVCITMGCEKFKLKDQSAQNCNRYDFIKDISRIETCLRKNQAKCGFAIFLTNDPNYWEQNGKNAIDQDFRIHCGRRICAGCELKWKDGASQGTKKGREDPIKLENNYRFCWKNYSGITNNKDCLNRTKHNVFVRNKISRGKLKTKR